MRLTKEHNGVRRALLAALFLFVAGLLGSDAWQMGAYLGAIGGMGLRGNATASTPLQMPVVSFASDAQTWIRYALQLDETKSVRLRYTEIDNAPTGREVHWNSAWAWVIAGAGRIRKAFSDEPLPFATERAAIWVNPVVLFAIVIVFSWWTAQRAGVVAGVVVAFGMVGSDRFYEGFIPSYVDHHGLLTAAVFGVVLGVTFMGAGWWHPLPGENTTLLPGSERSVRAATIFSSVCGAIGLWISAASVVPAISIVGLAALAMTMACGRTAIAEGAIFNGATWRLWGRTGAILSLVFYLLEYAPSHFGMRLEANHPLYALAWWGGGELVASLGEWWVTRGKLTGRDWARIVAAVLVVIAVPVTILVGGSRVFALRDPFLANLHHRIFEFMSLPMRVQAQGWRETLRTINLEVVPLEVAAVLLIWLRRRTPLLLWFSTGSSLAFLAMGIWQERWLLNSSGPLICTALVVLALLASHRRWIELSIGVTALAALDVSGAVTRVVRVHQFVERRMVAAKDGLQPLFRDVAAAIRASQPSGDIVLLASPNSSTGVGYYGRFKTIGTLYWENDAGLKTAAEIFSAHDDDDAARMIREHGITHIAMISEENFLQPYYELLHPGKAADVTKSFGFRLLFERKFPVWLEVLPYTVPPDLKGINVTVLLFKVAFNQTLEEAYYHLGEAQIAWQNLASASNTFHQLLQVSPQGPLPYLGQADIFIHERRWQEASEQIEKAIGYLAAADRGRIYGAGAEAYFDAGAKGYAALMWRNALATGFNPDWACSLAWILCTSTNDALRQPAEALEFAQQAANANPHSPAFLACLAAALAENGRMPEAIRAAITARDHPENSPAAVAKLNRQISEYRAGRPWRE